jgi:hypothetical protein
MPAPQRASFLVAQGNFSTVRIDAEYTGINADFYFYPVMVYGDRFDESSYRLFYGGGIGVFKIKLPLACPALYSKLHQIICAIRYRECV